MSEPGSPTSSFREELTTARILKWASGLETFERVDFVHLLMHSLFPMELRYIHGIVDSLLKRDESLCAASVHQANDFARLSHYYESHDPQAVIAEDGLRRQLIVDLSALHPLNAFCADIFYNVLMRANLSSWTFDARMEKMLKELILIGTLMARHPAFRFEHRRYAYNITRALMQRLKIIQEISDSEMIAPPPLSSLSDGLSTSIVPAEPPTAAAVSLPSPSPALIEIGIAVANEPILSTAGSMVRPAADQQSQHHHPQQHRNSNTTNPVVVTLVNGHRDQPPPPLHHQQPPQPPHYHHHLKQHHHQQVPPPLPLPPVINLTTPLAIEKPSALLGGAFPPLGNSAVVVRPVQPPLDYASLRPKIAAGHVGAQPPLPINASQEDSPSIPQSESQPVLRKDAYPLPHERANSLGHYPARQQRNSTDQPANSSGTSENGPLPGRRTQYSKQRSVPLEYDQTCGTDHSSQNKPNNAITSTTATAVAVEDTALRSTTATVVGDVTIEPSVEPSVVVGGGSSQQNPSGPSSGPSNPSMNDSRRGGGGMKMVGQFPQVYSMNLQQQNGPQSGQAMSGGAGGPSVPQPHPQLQSFQNSLHTGSNSSGAGASCFVCGEHGEHGHNGTVCPRRPALDLQQADKYCTIRRDAKQYQDTGRVVRSRQPPHHGNHHN
ncbi:hypothetical protein BV898_02627 [Hypsibius exemplaris]|uniref:SMAUG/ZCCHC2-like PHAT domain-containing protein n=1 Tax=Hypsibius exemplaris TaxID=2072580 RepID=A0A1W0X806_HYPEX|nr:hypothetical protein BV898_02627 [Hypsibius exemplaris]